MSISRYIVIAVARCSRASAGLPARRHRGEPQVAVGDEGTHGESTGKRQSLSMVELSFAEIRRVGVGVQRTQLKQSARLERAQGLRSSELERSSGERPRLGRSTGQAISDAELAQPQRQKVDRALLDGVVHRLLQELDTLGGA